MQRKTVFLLTVTLVLTSVVHAGIEQNEGFVVGGLNNILSNGPGMVTSFNPVAISNQQVAFGSCGTFACEGELATFNQSGVIMGSSGFFSVNQVGGAGGGQQQGIFGSFSPAFQGQTLGTGLNQVVTKSPDAQGMATASQSFNGTQGQSQGCIGTTMSEHQQINASQSSLIAGGPGSGAVVLSGISGYTSQAQMVY